MDNGLIELKSLEDLEKALAESSKRPVLLFKHSLTCPISARAFREFEAYLQKAHPGASYNLITVQKARPVSSEAAARLGIRHESPQAIIVRNGQGIWNASHLDITADTLDEAIKNAAR